MGFTKRELIQFLDGLVELASEENKGKAVLARSLSDVWVTSLFPFCSTKLI